MQKHLYVERTCTKPCITAGADKTPALVYTQTWSDIKYTLAIVAILFVIYLSAADHPQEAMAVLLTFLFVTAIVIFVFKYIAIRKLEFHPDYILFEFPRNVVRRFNRNEIARIVVEREPAFVLGNRSKSAKTVFRFTMLKEIDFLLYGKKISVNNYFFGDLAEGESVKQLTEFLQKHYGEILEFR